MLNHLRICDTAKFTCQYHADINLLYGSPFFPLMVSEWALRLNSPALKKIQAAVLRWAFNNSRRPVRTTEEIRCSHYKVIYHK